MSLENSPHFEILYQPAHPNKCRPQTLPHGKESTTNTCVHVHYTCEAVCFPISMDSVLEIQPSILELLPYQRVLEVKFHYSKILRKYSIHRAIVNAFGCTIAESMNSLKL